MAADVYTKAFADADKWRVATWLINVADPRVFDEAAAFAMQESDEQALPDEPQEEDTNATVAAAVANAASFKIKNLSARFRATLGWSLNAGFVRIATNGAEPRLVVSRLLLTARLPAVTLVARDMCRPLTALIQVVVCGDGRFLVSLRTTVLPFRGVFTVRGAMTLVLLMIFSLRKNLYQLDR